MGRKPDGDSHPSSISVYPLRTNNLESSTQSVPSPSGDIPIEPDLANSGTDPTTNGFYGLSEMELDERQEGAKETTITDNTKPPYFDSTVLNANNMSHISFTEQHKIINISVVSSRII